MQTRKASIKETGEELTQADWQRFDAAVAATKADRAKVEGPASLTGKRAPRSAGPKRGAADR